MYIVLDTDLHKIANLAKVRLENKFNIKINNIETGFNNELSYAPTYWGKNKTHFIVCEVSNRPFPLTIKSIYADIMHLNLSVKYYVIYPNEISISASELNKDLDNARLFGIGLLKVDESTNSINVQQEAISIPLNFSPSNLQLNKYNKKLRHLIEEAYSMYISGNPKHAVQELGQIIERAIKNVAIEAKASSHYNDGHDPNSPTTAFGNIINDLIRHAILNVTFLNRVRGYTEDRNSVSHRVNSIAASIKLENKLKLDFQNALRILEELPINTNNGKNGFKYKLNII